MADDNGVVIKISGNAEDFEKAAAQVKQILGTIGEEGKKSIGVADIAFGTFIGHLAEAGVEKAIELIVEGFHKVIEVLEHSVHAAAEEEVAFNKLSFALATSGKYSEEASEKFEHFAESMQQSTKVSKELIATSAATLESLVNLDEKGLERATKAAIDFSAATGRDLGSSVEIIARGVEGQTQAFRRAGIQIEDMGNKSQNLDNILRELEGRFGGAGQAAAQTFSGTVTGMKQAIEDLEQTVGSFVTKSPAVRAAIDGLKDVFLLLNKTFLDNKSSINKFIDEGVDLFIQGIGAAGKSLAFFLEVKKDFQIFINFITDVFLAAEIQFLKFSKGINDVKESIIETIGGKAVDAVAALVGVVNPAAAAMISLGEGTKNASKEYEKQIKTLEEVRNLQNDELGATLKSNEDKQASIEKFTESTVKLLRDRVEAARAAQEEETEAVKEGISNRRQSFDAAAEEEKSFQSLLADEQIEETRDVFGKLDAMRLQEQYKKLIEEGKYVELSKKMDEQDVKNKQNSIFTIQKYDELGQKQRLDNLKGTLGSIATLEQSSNETLFAIGKAANFATATIDGIQAVQKALASAPPPFNFVLAALVGVAQAENLSRIASAQPPKGAAEGALVEGGIGGIDTEPFMLSKGEIVAPAKNFEEVVSGVASQRGLVPSDEAQGNQEMLSILRQIRDNPPVSVSVSVDYNKLEDDLYINALTKKIRDAVQFRAAQLA